MAEWARWTVALFVGSLVGEALADWAARPTRPVVLEDGVVPVIVVTGPWPAVTPDAW
jgi:hypothetical protein